MLTVADDGATGKGRSCCAATLASTAPTSTTDTTGQHWVRTPPRSWPKKPPNGCCAEKKRTGIGPHPSADRPTGRRQKQPDQTWPTPPMSGGLESLRRTPRLTRAPTPSPTWAKWTSTGFRPTRSRSRRRDSARGSEVRDHSTVAARKFHRMPTQVNVTVKRVARRGVGPVVTAAQSSHDGGSWSGAAHRVPRAPSFRGSAAGAPGGWGVPGVVSIAAERAGRGLDGPP
jgi:hypothetical protein